jgi:hypothetical protein
LHLRTQGSLSIKTIKVKYPLGTNRIGWFQEKRRGKIKARFDGLLRLRWNIPEKSLRLIDLKIYAQTRAVYTKRRKVGVFFFFLVYAGSGTGQSVLLIWADPEHRES